MFIKNNQRKQENDQKALKEYLGNGVFIEGFEKIQHIPENLEGHVLMHTIYMFRKKTENTLICLLCLTVGFCTNRNLKLMQSGKLSEPQYTHTATLGKK